MNKLLYGSACSLSLAAVCASCASAPGDQQAPQVISAFALPSDQGALATIPQPSADFTVLDAFGPTCEPCRERVPALLSRRAELQAMGAKLVLVAVLGDGETTADGAAALRNWGSPAPFLIDRGDGLATRLGLRGLPSTFILDRDGALVWSSQPDSSDDDVLEAVRRAVTNRKGGATHEGP